MVVSNIWIIVHFIYGIIIIPLTNSYFSKDGYCTTKQCRNVGAPLHPILIIELLHLITQNWDIIQLNIPKITPINIIVGCVLIYGVMIPPLNRNFWRGIICWKSMDTLWPHRMAFWTLSYPKLVFLRDLKLGLTSEYMEINGDYWWNRNWQHDILVCLKMGHITPRWQFLYG